MAGTARPTIFHEKEKWTGCIIIDVEGWVKVIWGGNWEFSGREQLIIFDRITPTNRDEDAGLTR